MKNTKMFRKLYIIISILLLIVMFFVYFYNSVIDRPLKSQGNDDIIVEVKKGEGFYDILNKLDSNNNLRSKLCIKLNLVLNEKNISINEGIYELNKETNLSDIIDLLSNEENNKNLVKLTIPEGYTIDEISKKVEQEELCSAEGFIAAIKKYELPEFLEKDSERRYNLEGFLYPDTYFIQKGSSPTNIITLMLNRFNEVIDEIQTENKFDDKKIGDIITIASMIEKEARVDDDRPLISSVIYNRLKKDMKLQLDATVLYSLGYHVDKVYNKHLDTDSPYNTYKYKGLPIGPICSPAKSSIEAALSPSDSKYLYYILEDNFKHYFTDNYQDFLSKKKELGY